MARGSTHRPCQRVPRAFAWHPGPSTSATGQSSHVADAGSASLETDIASFLAGDSDLRVGWVGPSGELKGAKAEQVDGRSSWYLYEQLPVRSCCQSGRRLNSATSWSDAEVVVFYVGGDEKLHFQIHNFVGLESMAFLRTDGYI